MAWIAEFLSRFFNKPDSHIYLAQKSHWRVLGFHDFGMLLGALPSLVPAESILYIENTGFCQDVAEYLSRYAIVNPNKVIERGTILPRPKSFHVPVSDAVMNGLAEISKRHAEPEVADHMVAYSQLGILLEWYDAGMDPIYVSKEIPEATVAAFCTKTGTKYDELI